MPGITALAIDLGGSHDPDSRYPALFQKYVDAHAWTPGRTVRLCRSSCGPEAALLDAIPLIESSL